MSVGLLDVNVLIALFDPMHLNHEDAHQWFGRNRKQGWATCPLTINGCVRILTNLSYPNGVSTAAEAIASLQTVCSGADHQTWADEVSLLDGTLFRPSMIAGHRKITDAYLLGLAVRKKGALITFDKTIPLKAVIGADNSRLHCIGRSQSQLRLMVGR